MLTDAELAVMRDAVLELLPDTCNILSLTETSDGAGGWSEAWGTASAGISCRVDYRSGREVITGGALMPYQSAVISMPYDVTITPANRVEVGTSIFSVQAVNQAQSWQVVTRVTAELIP